MGIVSNIFEKIMKVVTSNTAKKAGEDFAVKFAGGLGTGAGVVVGTSLAKKAVSKIEDKK